jgi:uncharacterized protein (TIGR03067 family)
MTRCLLVLALAIGFAITARAEDKKDEKKDKADAKKLEGTWTATSWERGPGKIGADQVKTELVIKKDTFEYPTGINRVAPKGVYAIDAEKGTIDFVPDAGPAKGKTILGIYKMEGDKLTICFAGTGGDRPKEFKSGDRMIVLATYERKKEK